jgi:hypothetical protein
VLDRHYVIVIDRPGDESGLAGGLVIRTRTGRYLLVDLVTVLPGHRGSGWSWALVAQAQSIGNALGLAGTAAIAATNPMNLDDHLGDDTFVAVDLVAPRRFRGQGRLRRLYGRYRPLHAREPIWFREPGEPPVPGAV